MDWPYHFSNLAPERVLHRRHLLDRYAQIAQLSVLLPLFLIRFLHITHDLLQYLAVSRKVKSGQKKHEKRSGSSSSLGKTATFILVVWGKLAWWMDGEVWLGWGTRREAIAAGFWVVWLGWCAVWETGDGK